MHKNCHHVVELVVLAKQKQNFQPVTSGSKQNQFDSKSIQNRFNMICNVLTVCNQGKIIY